MHKHPENCHETRALPFSHTSSLLKTEPEERWGSTQLARSAWLSAVEGGGGESGRLRSLMLSERQLRPGVSHQEVQVRGPCLGVVIHSSDPCIIHITMCCEEKRNICPSQ